MGEGIAPPTKPQPRPHRRGFLFWDRCGIVGANREGIGPAPPAMAHPLDPDELRACLASLSWSQNQLARVLQDAGVKIDDRAIRRMATGQNPVPAKLAKWLRVLAAHHDANPVPPSIWD